MGPRRLFARRRVSAVSAGTRRRKDRRHKALATTVSLGVAGVMTAAMGLTDHTPRNWTAQPIMVRTFDPVSGKWMCRLLPPTTSANAWSSGGTAPEPHACSGGSSF